MSIPAGFPKFAEESLLALLLIRSLRSLLFRWDGIVTLQSICAHVVDLAHLKQHIRLLHVICCAARIRTTAQSGRSNDHWKHPHGQCGKGQPHGGKSHRERALRGIKITGRNEVPTKVEPDFADMHKLHPQASSKHVSVQSQHVIVWLICIPTRSANLQSV